MEFEYRGQRFFQVSQCMRNIQSYYDNKVPGKLDEDEFKELIVKAQAGDIEARHAIVSSVYLLVMKIANSYARPGLEIDDLFQTGIVGVLNAIDKYTVGFDYRFTTFCSTCVINQIRVYIRSLKLDRELIPLDTPISMGPDGTEVYLMDMIPSPDMTPEEIVQRDALRDIIDDMLHIFPEERQLFLCKRFGLRGYEPRKLKELCEEHGVIRNTMSRRIKSMLTTIRLHYSATLR